MLRRNECRLNFKNRTVRTGDIKGGPKQPPLPLIGVARSLPLIGLKMTAMWNIARYNKESVSGKIERFDSFMITKAKHLSFGRQQYLPIYQSCELKFTPQVLFKTSNRYRQIMSGRHAASHFISIVDYNMSSGFEIWCKIKLQMGFPVRCFSLHWFPGAFAVLYAVQVPFQGPRIFLFLEGYFETFWPTGIHYID